MKKISYLLTFLILVASCSMEVMIKEDKEVSLDAWNKGVIKSKIVNFVNDVTTNGDKFVPVEDRIAVFDMDGTISCEKPVWIEMYMSLDYLNKKAIKDPSLYHSKDSTFYIVARDYFKDPFNKENLDLLEDNVMPMLEHSFVGWNQETYVNHVDKIISSNYDPKFKIRIKDTFYKPMIEVIDYLLENKFQVYIVSGSEQGLIWGACRNMVPLKRENEIGTNIALHPVYKPEKNRTEFIRGNKYLDPRNLKDGKSEHIYYHLGKKPILAFGNTADDFGMFRYTSTNAYPNIAFIINHNDSIKEYNYPDPKTKKAWMDTVNCNGWNVVSIKDDFKEVFVK